MRRALDPGVRAVGFGLIAVILLGCRAFYQDAAASGPASSTPASSTSSEVAASESPQAATNEPAPSDDGVPLPTADESQPIVASEIPADLVAAMERSGIHLSPLAADIPIPDAEALQAAIDVARANFGPEGTAVAIPATVTVDGYLEGGEGTPRRIEDRSVIAVQITGLSMHPFGNRPGDPPVPTSEYSTELVVFIDAATFEYLMASSTR